MISVKGLRVGVSVAVFALTGLSAGLVSLGSASATTVPKLVVKPSTKLHNGERVQVSGRGFKPGDSVYIVECLFSAKGAAGCNISGAIPATITAAGILPKKTFKVITGKIGNGKCGTKASNLKTCAISAGNISGGDSAVARITFKALR
ncbi:MAG TPA: neocarzinostatin apoprotein domain-containing protein [Acidimicrobiales bacterium]|nr:neocarzinostatin apoprotein domain-containing protein [Acidimicrobiales bacterium]